MGCFRFVNGVCASVMLVCSASVWATPLPSFVIGTECEAGFMLGRSPGGDVQCRSRVDVDGDGRAEEVSFRRAYGKSRVEVIIKNARSGKVHRFEKPTIDDLGNEATNIRFGLFEPKAVGASIFMLDMPRAASCDSGSRTYFLSYSPARGIQVAA